MWDLINTPIYAGILLSIAIGIIGSLIVINKATAITGSIAHGSFGGIGIAIFLGSSVFFTTTLFTIALSLILSFISFKYPHRLDSFLGVIWAVGMSVGILFLSLSNGYHADVMSYLFGNILLIDNQDLMIMGGIDIILIISIILFYNYFLAMSYDKEFLYLRDINANLIYTIFLVLTSLSIVMSVRAIGIILVLALFTIPPLIAEKWTNKFYKMIILSAILAVIFISSGILISVNFDIAPTPAIVIIASAGLFLSLFKRS